MNRMVPREISKFENDTDLWNEISSNYPDIYVARNLSDNYDWHVTITNNKSNNGSQYQFHSIVMWNHNYPRVQPKS